MGRRNRILIFLLILFFVAAAVAMTLSFFKSTPTNKTTNQAANTNGLNTNANKNENLNTTSTNTPPTPTTTKTTTSTPNVVLPIAGFFDRITKKPYGIYITPKTSPVQPERFTGYHTGADAETTPAESSIDIPIYSIANGTIAYTGYVSGYGGVVIIYYAIDGQSLTALYGHLRFASVAVKKNQTVSAGQKIAVLGTGYSTETNSERKHLHFGLLTGHVINYKGYVQTKVGLSSWMDPLAWLKSHNAIEPK